MPSTGGIRAAAVEQQVVEQHIVPAEAAALVDDNRRIGASSRTACTTGAAACSCTRWRYVAQILIGQSGQAPIDARIEVCLHFVRRPFGQLRLGRFLPVGRSFAQPAGRKQHIGGQRHAEGSGQDLKRCSDRRPVYRGGLDRSRFAGLHIFRRTARGLTHGFLLIHVFHLCSPFN